MAKLLHYAHHIDLSPVFDDLAIHNSVDVNQGPL
jgi:hypothetical protein